MASIPKKHYHHLTGSNRYSVLAMCISVPTIVDRSFHSIQKSINEDVMFVPPIVHGKKDW